MPTITSPRKQRFLTNGAAVLVAATGAGDSAINLHVNGTSVGAMTNTGGDNWTFSWTPAAVAASAVLTAVGNVSGTSAPVTVTVAAQNCIATDITTWGSSWCARAVSAGTPHPDGSGTVYTAIPYAAGSNNLAVGRALSPSPTIKESSVEIWLGVAATNPLRCAQFNAGFGGYINFDTLETTAGDCYIWPMEQVTIGSIKWTRVQMLRSSGGAVANGYTLNIAMCRGFTTPTPTITAGERPNCILYMASPYAVGTVVAPFLPHQQMSWHYHPTNTAAIASVGGAEISYKHPWMDEVANMAGGAYPSGFPYVRLIFPTGYNKSNTYNGLLFLPPLTEVQQGSDPTTWATMSDAAADYANTYNCICILPFQRDGTHWWGKRTVAPLRRGGEWLEEVLFQWLGEVFNVSQNPDDRCCVTYSKGPNAALGTKLIKPSFAGWFAFGDGAWLNMHPANQADGDYNTAALYNARDPKQILAANKASIADTKRITLQAGPSWSPDHASFTAQLTSEGVPFDVITPAFTEHRWGPTGINGGWTPNIVAAMFAQREAYLSAPPASASNRMFLMF